MDEVTLNYLVYYSQHKWLHWRIKNTPNNSITQQQDALVNIKWIISYHEHLSPF